MTQTSIMTHSYKHAVLLCGIAVLSISGCKGPSVTDVVPNYVPAPQAVSFSACASKDEKGAPITDVFPDRQKLVITNRSQVEGGLKLSITGRDADAFAVTKPMPPASIGPQESIDVYLQFRPEKQGGFRAELTIDDEYEGTENEVIALIGTVRDLPAEPLLGVSPQKKDMSDFYECKPQLPARPFCTLEFPDTSYNQKVTREVIVRNNGCPALKVTGLGIESSLTNQQQGFSIDSPIQLPSSLSPILLTSEYGNEEVKVRISFSPLDDGTSNTDRLASLVILTNDASAGDGKKRPAHIDLSATANSPSTYVTPTTCDFEDPMDTCGEDSKVANVATFKLFNAGNVAVQVKSLTFQSSAESAGRFTLTKDITGDTIAPSQSATFKITHTDMPVYVGVRLDIVAVVPGPPEKEAGRASVAVYGGRKPCLVTEPSEEIVFSDSVNVVSTKPLSIRNDADCGKLIVNEVYIDENPFFSLAEPLLEADTEIAAGNQVMLNVQYLRPPSGGTQVRSLHIRSNDSDYGPPQHKLVRLLSQIPFDRKPVARLSACTPEEIQSDAQCAKGATREKTVSLVQLGSKKLTLSGVQSTDDNQVAKYRFMLLPLLPRGVATTILEQHNVTISSPTTKLTLPGNIEATYRIALEVWDNQMQKSSMPSILLLHVGR